MVRIFGNLEIQLSNIWKSLVIFVRFLYFCVRFLSTAEGIDKRREICII